jgi:hypothetical protein
MKPTNDYPSGIYLEPLIKIGLLISSGSDKTIFVFEPYNTSNIVWRLEGHSDNVCALAVGYDGEIISGSWDK